MTSLIGQILTDALRESGLIAVGANPEADESFEALRVLNRMYRGLFGNELGDQLASINYGSTGLTNSSGLTSDHSSDIDMDYVPSNTRLIFNNTGAKTLYLNPVPQDGARLGVIDNLGNFSTSPITLSGNGRRIEGLSAIALNADSINREWFYRADLNNWLRLVDLKVTDENPLPIEFDDLLITMLALRLNPRYAAESGQTLEILYRTLRSRFRSRYNQEIDQPSEIGLTRLTYVGRQSRRYYK